jgi:hypothetical protein
LNSGNHSFQQHHVGGPLPTCQVPSLPTSLISNIFFVDFTLGSTLERGQYQDKGPHWLLPLSSGTTLHKRPSTHSSLSPLYSLSKGKDPAAYLRQAFPRFLWLWGGGEKDRPVNVRPSVIWGSSTSLQIAHKNNRTSTDLGPSLSTFLGTPLTQALPLYSL